jgi:hypothetical protein
VTLHRRKPRMVRIHFKPAVSPDSVEGILVRVAAGHYQLVNARHISAESETSRAIDGEAWIPCENVLYPQVIG